MVNITYQKLLENVNIPVMTDEGIHCLLDWYLSGKKDPSRQLKLAEYKEPYTGNLDDAFFAEQQAAVIFKIIQFIKKNLQEFSYEELVEKYLKCYWFTSKLQLTKLELVILCTASYQEVKALLQKEPDNRNSKFLKNIRSRCTDFKEEHIGNALSFPYGEEINYKGRGAQGYEFRIYLNGPNDNSRYEFLSIYIQKCISYGIPFQMKGDGAMTSHIDNIILYTNSTCLTKNLEVLEEIKVERPDLIEKFGSPICSGNNISYYGVTHAGKIHENGPMNGLFKQTYNDYFNYISELAYLSLICEYALEDHKIPYYAYSEVAKENSITVDEVYAILAKYRDINPLLLNNTHIDAKERGIVTKLCNEYQFNPYYKIVFLSAKEKKELEGKYKNKIKLLASMLNFGNKEHTDFPVCFDNVFYKALIAEEYLEGCVNNQNDYSLKANNIIQDDDQSNLNI